MVHRRRWRGVTAQAPAARNPLEGDATAVKSGMGLFRARCADCHGMDARGVRGPDITQVWASGRTDEGLFTTIKNGIAGTEMPAQPRLFDHETWQILAYLRTLAASSRPEPPRGNAENGEKIYQRQLCASCHRVNGAGGRLGPDLSRIGAARSREVLELRIRGGVEGFLPGYEPVTADASKRPGGRRREEERGSLLGADHGHARAHPGLRQDGAQGDAEQPAVGDAALWLQSDQRERAR